MAIGPDTDDLSLARAQATQDLYVAILNATGDAMAVHGNDPQRGAIVAAGFAMTLRAIGRNIDRHVPLTVLEMLGESV